MALITAADVDWWAPQATAAGSGVVAEAIRRAQGLADDYCHRPLELAAFSLYLDVPDYIQTLALGRWPLVVDATHTLTVTADPDSTAPTTVDATDYAADTVAGRLISLEGYWNSGLRALKVEGYAGYTSTTAPAGLKTALVKLVAWLISSRGGGGVQSESVDGYSVTLEPMVGNMPQSIAALFDPYKRVGISWA